MGRIRCEMILDTSNGVDTRCTEEAQYTSTDGTFVCLTCAVKLDREGFMSLGWSKQPPLALTSRR